MGEERQPVEVQINKFLKENKYKTEEQIKEMTIQSKMSYSSMKSEEKWKEFKLGLRKAGYII